MNFWKKNHSSWEISKDKDDFEIGLLAKYLSNIFCRNKNSGEFQLDKKLHPSTICHFPPPPPHCCVENFAKDFIFS